jgi:prepilin peptidase CpaA
MLALIVAVALPAVWVDSREHRIPNKLVALTLALGLALQVWARGPDGSFLALAGIAVGTFFLLPFHIAGAMGAGDVKFMGALGAALGPVGAVAACALTLVAGSLLAMATVGWRRWSPTAAAVPAPAVRAARIPYAAAIATGSLGAALWISQIN